MLYDIDSNSQEDVSFGTIGEIMEARTYGRIKPIHYGVNYHGTPLQFKLVFGSETPLDREDLERVSFWLQGYQDYQWLNISQPDLEHVQFRCLITELTPITVGWLPYAFSATVVCDCPYAYGYPFEYTYTINGQTNIVVKNFSTMHEYFKPVLEFEFANQQANQELSIINTSDNNRRFLLSGVPSTVESIYVDNDRCIMKDTTENGGDDNLYRRFNLRFLRLVDGDNNLTVSGYGTLKISGRFMYNVGG